MRSTQPQLDRSSALLTALAFGLLAMLLPAPAPPPFVASPVVLTDAVLAPDAPPTVALTFDDGPDPRWTPEILAVLARHGAVATFCMVGSQVDEHPDLVRQVVAAGMRLCDHSHSHDEQLPERATSRMAGEIVGTQHGLAEVGGAPVPYFRAPAGNWSPAVLEMAAGAQMQPLGWSVDPRDWRKPGADAIVATVQEHVHPGAVVLLHDGGGNREQTVAALERMLPWLVEQGYRFGFPTP